MDLFERFVTVVGSLVAGGFGLLMFQFLQQRYTQKRQLRKDAIEEFQTIVETLRDEHRNCQEMIRRADQRAERAERRSAEARGRVAYLETVMRSHGWVFRSWVDSEQRKEDDTPTEGPVEDVE